MIISKYILLFELQYTTIYKITYIYFMPKNNESKWETWHCHSELCEKRGHISVHSSVILSQMKVMLSGNVGGIVGSPLATSVDITQYAQ